MEATLRRLIMGVAWTSGYEALRVIVGAEDTKGFCCLLIENNVNTWWLCIVWIRAGRAEESQALDDAHARTVVEAGATAAALQGAVRRWHLQPSS